MKAKKALFLIAGILRVVVSGFAILFSLIALLIRKTIRTFLDSSFDVIEDIIKKAGDVEDNTGILAYSRSELLDYLLNIFTILFVIILVVAIIWLIYGIINIRLGSGNRFLHLTKGKTVLLLLCGWTIAFELFTNIMITVAVCIKNKVSEEKLYTQASATNTIEVK